MHAENDKKLDRSRYETERADSLTTKSSNHQKRDDDTINDSEIRSREKQKLNNLNAGEHKIPYRKRVCSGKQENMGQLQTN